MQCMRSVGVKGLLVLIGVLGLLVVGCGGGGPEAAPDSVDVDAAIAEAVAAALAANAAGATDSPVPWC